MGEVGTVGGGEEGSERRGMDAGDVTDCSKREGGPDGDVVAVGVFARHWIISCFFDFLDYTS